MSLLESFKDIASEFIKDPEAEAKLMDLRKELAESYVQKLEKEKSDLILSVGRDFVVDYLVDEGISDKFHDAMVEKALSSLSSLSGDLKEFREKLKKSETEEELNVLKAEIEGSISTEVNHEGETQEQNKISDTTNAIASTPAAVGLSTDQNSDQTPSKIINHQGNAEIEQKEENLKVKITPEIQQFYDQLKGKEKPDIKPFALAMTGYEKLKSDLKNPTYLTVVDFSVSNKEKRMFVINMENKTVEITEQVGHGKNTGGEFAKNFSNTSGSLQSSLGFFRTPAEIQKSNSKSWSGLKMKGIEESNSKASTRGIYMHPAPVNGSEGCFTLPMKQEEANQIMDKLKGDSLLFAYYPDQQYVDNSKYLAA